MSLSEEDTTLRDEAASLIEDEDHRAEQAEVAALMDGLRAWE